VRGGDKVVGHTEEVLEEGECGGEGGVCVEFYREVYALAGDGFVESGRVVSKPLADQMVKETYFLGWSMGWSVTTNASKLSPASLMALISSGVKSVSVISAFSLMTVVQMGSLAWSLVAVRDRS
jgi:hypothetical protein